MMGALEKLYRQPSLGAAVLLVVREPRRIATERPHAKSVVPRLWEREESLPALANSLRGRASGTRVCSWC